MLPEAQAILVKRSPSPREAPITSSTNFAETNNMATFTELLKNISHMVPIFYCTDGPKIGIETSKFIEGYMISKDKLGEKGSNMDILKCIRTILFETPTQELLNNRIAMPSSKIEIYKKSKTVRNTGTNIQQQAICAIYEAKC